MARSLDDKDWKLLGALAADSRRPLKALASIVGLSTSAVQERIARMEREGTIAGFTIRLAEEMKRVSAYMLVTTDSAQCEQVAPLLVGIPEILVCDSVAGEIDMILTVEAEHGARLQAIRDAIAALPGVKNVITAPRMVRRFARLTASGD